MLQDLQYAFRFLKNNRGFTAVAVSTVALAIGANAAIFSLVSAVLLRPLPYPGPEQLVGLGQWRNQKGQGYIQTGVSAPNIRDIAAAGVFRYVAYYRWADFNLTEGDRPESINGIRASTDLLPMFGVHPLLGRVLKDRDMEAGNDGVAVIGYHLWQNRYGADPNILGKQIRLNQKPYTVVGVMPGSFRFTWDQEIGAFIPLVLTPEERSEIGRGTSRDLQTQARLNPGISVEKAQAAMNALAVNLAKQYPAANEGWGIKVEPLHAAYHRRMTKPLFILLGAVILVLLIACANVSNLLLARTTARKREISIRFAIGANRRRILKQLLTESLLLAVIGGALGLALAYAGDRLLTVALNRYGFSLPNARVIDLDWRVLLFGLGVTISTGFFFGLAPAWITTESALNESLKEGALSTTAEAGLRHVRKVLVVSEVAFAFLLLTGAGLLVRSFTGLLNVDLGIEPKNVVTFGLSLPAYKYPSAVQHQVFFRNLVSALEAIPGVKSAGIDSGGASVFFQPQGQAAARPGQEPTALFEIVTPDYLKAMGTGLVQGRNLNDRDKEGSPDVALVSETLARRYWPDANPLGQRLTILEQVWSGQKTKTKHSFEVVGVVKDVRNENIWRSNPEIYVPFEQNPDASAVVAVRTAGAPLSIMPAVQRAIHSIDKEQPVNEVRTMQQIVSETYGAIEFPMMLVWAFSALALLLSAIGIFGVMSYTVSRRTREMAIRMVLGANRERVLRIVLLDAVATGLIGIALGLVGSLTLSRVIASYLYGVTATDPLTLAGSALVLIAVALLGSYLPARKAAGVNPISALRQE